jgi:stress-induced-phosphoprotein 1
MASPESQAQSTTARKAAEEAELQAREEASRRRTHASWAPKKEKSEKELAAEQAAAEAEAARKAAEAADPKRVEAESAKAEGNALYKQKNFSGAIACYEAACAAFPADMCYRLNIAAALLASRKYAEAALACDEALATAKANRSTSYNGFEMIAKALARKGTALGKAGRWSEAIRCYEDSLLEKHDSGVEKKLKGAKKALKKAEADAYLNKEEGEAAKARGNILFKEGKWKDAIAEYSDAIKRDPTNAKYFCNRGACYTKLMAFDPALKDVTQAIKLDPKYVKAYGRKGCIEFFLKRYNAAMETFRKGIELDPSDEACVDGLKRTVTKVNQVAQSGTAEERDAMRAEAMKDPEIQNILRDPVVQSVLEDMQKNPQSMGKHLANPGIAEKINKLVGAGIIGMG